MVGVACASQYLIIPNDRRNIGCNILNVLETYAILRPPLSYRKTNKQFDAVIYGYAKPGL